MSIQVVRTRGNQSAPLLGGLWRLVLCCCRLGNPESGRESILGDERRRGTLEPVIGKESRTILSIDTTNERTNRNRDHYQSERFLARFFFLFHRKRVPKQSTITITSIFGRANSTMRMSLTLYHRQIANIDFRTPGSAPFVSLFNIIATHYSSALFWLQW